MIIFEAKIAFKIQRLITKNAYIKTTFDALKDYKAFKFFGNKGSTVLTLNYIDSFEFYGVSSKSSIKLSSLNIIICFN